MTDISTLEQNVRTAQAALDAAKAEVEQERKLERMARQAAAVLAVTEADDSDFVAKDPTSRYSERPYVLPFGREYGRWNPRDVENAAFGKSWLAGSTALICKRIDEARTRPSRLIFTSGTLLHDSDKIGNVFTARHDQTNAKLGVYEIVGLVFYGPTGDVARIVGDVPDAKLSQNTYK